MPFADLPFTLEGLGKLIGTTNRLLAEYHDRVITDFVRRNQKNFKKTDRGLADSDFLVLNRAFGS
jgi:hypothetical protein